jgi:hypothetical protein
MCGVVVPGTSAWSIILGTTALPEKHLNYYMSRWVYFATDGGCWKGDPEKRRRRKTHECSLHSICPIVSLKNALALTDRSTEGILFSKTHCSP